VASPTSRYHDNDVATLEVIGPDGQSRPVAYLRRRFVPPLPAATDAAQGAPTLAESGLTVTTTGQTLHAHVVDSSDRLDLLAWLSLGDPLLFWRIADVNPCFLPDELTDELGRWIVVPQGSAAGRPRAGNPF
jgi:hypothetical protein